MGATMGRLTTHVLDTRKGVPAKGVRIELFRVGDGNDESIAEAVTNANGRTDAPLLEGDAMTSDIYEIRFHVGAYFGESEGGGAGSSIFDLVPVRVGISDPGAHYHIPLLVSPFSYTTYRGS